MGDLRLGTSRPDALYAGSQAVSKVYWGTEQVWPSAAPPVVSLTWATTTNPDNPGEYKRFDNRIACNATGVEPVIDVRTFWQQNDGMAFTFHDDTGALVGTIYPGEYYMQADAGILYPGPNMYDSDHPVAVEMLSTAANKGRTYTMTVGNAYVAKALSLGATFIQFGGIDYITGSPLGGGTNPGVSIDGIAAWTGSFTLDIGDQMAAGGDWSACAIFRRVDDSTAAADLTADSGAASTRLRSYSNDTDTLGRVYHGNLNMNSAPLLSPKQWGQDWCFGGFSVEAASTTARSRFLQWDGTWAYHSRTRSSDPGTLSRAIVSNGEHIEYAGFCIFPNVLLTDIDFEDLYSLLPHVGQGLNT